MTRMTRSTALLAFFVIALACTDDGSNTDEVGETGDGDGDSSTSAGDTSDTTTESSTTNADTSTTTTETTTDSTTETTDTTDTTGTTDSTTGEPDNSTYSAVAFPGGLDRVIITRVNPDEPSCSEMVLVKPGFDMYTITLPANWAVEQVRSWDQLDCDPMVTPDSLGKSGPGTIEFLGTDAFGLYPCALSIEAEIAMDTDPPSSMIWFSDFVLVDGVNCG